MNQGPTLKADSPSTYVQFKATPEAIAATIEVLDDRVKELELVAHQIHDDLVRDGHWGELDCSLCEIVRRLEAAGIS